MFFIGGGIGAALLYFICSIFFKKFYILKFLLISILGGLLSIELAFVKYGGGIYNPIGLLIVFPLWQATIMYLLAKFFIYDDKKNEE